MLPPVNEEDLCRTYEQFLPNLYSLGTGYCYPPFEDDGLPPPWREELDYAYQPYYKELNDD